ncbi:unnamed protein product [Dracunculus medinensis]|uniref:Class I SAM-dependent methyltransferase n=1 Tax=Dracunculus medinensis TaxID=318479 RepID=A0A0N4UJ05_DRAME|nr:unnamed protein product [Dracunculus medinensis]
MIEKNDRSDDWEGVSILCQALDTAFKYESESLVAGKSILEMGFCTGLPSVFSLTNRAAHVTLFSMEEIIMNDCVKPTLARNKVKPTQKRLIFGEFSDLRKSTDQNRFDIILASEYLNTDKFSYEELHDIIDYLLTPDGLCIFSSRMSYFHHEGKFIDLIKVKGKFDVFERWSSPKSDFVQRKVIQLTRVIR